MTRHVDGRACARTRGLRWLVLVLLGGCVLPPACPSDSERATQIRYARDARTGLCFATMVGDWRTMTHVPCEPVERLIERAP